LPPSGWITAANIYHAMNAPRDRRLGLAKALMHAGKRLIADEVVTRFGGARRHKVRGAHHRRACWPTPGSRHAA
jgi:hypothetical protein